MLEKAQKIVNKYNELSEQISSPDIINNHTKLAALAKEQSDLEPLYKKCQQYIFQKEAYQDNMDLINDDDLEIVSMAKEENESIIKEVKDSLRPHHKRVIELVVEQGLTYAQAAKEMGCPLGTIMSRVYLARQEAQKIIRRKNLL